MSRVTHTICDLLKQGEDLVLATIVSRAGSAPRTAGTKMIVRRDGDTISTVGGGLVEAEVIKAASEIFQTGKAQIRPFDLTGANVESMDLVCGGKLEILVEFIAANPANAQLFQQLSDSLKKRTKLYLVADLGSMGEPRPTVERCLIREDGNISGDMVCPSALVETVSRWSGKERYPVLLAIQGRDYLVEPSFIPGTVYLFGAGHVSQQVVPLAKLVDFHTVVMDDRAEFANRNRFPLTDEVLTISSFDNCMVDLDIDEDSYMVIVTRGHLHDKTVLEQALRTDARYIGMIGSRTKRDRIYRELEAQGFTAKDIARVHAPIGTRIGAETPEEIGVSIVGELILARSESSR
jgi:xanthine dehydrogenase accessory factor